MASEERPPGALSRIVRQGSEGAGDAVEEEKRRIAQQEKWRRMTPAQRRKARADAKRTKATYDLPEDVIAAVRQAASEEDVSQSDLVAELLVRALNAYRAGALVLDNQKVPARSLRWLYKLDISQLDAGE